MKCPECGGGTRPDLFRFRGPCRTCDALREFRAWLLRETGAREFLVWRVERFRGVDDWAVVGTTHVVRATVRREDASGRPRLYPHPESLQRVAWEQQAENLWLLRVSFSWAWAVELGRRVLFERQQVAP